MNTFFSRCCAAITLGCMLSATQVNAQDFRIGFISTDRIFKEASTAKAAQVKLEAEFSKREKEIVDMGANLKSMADKFFLIEKSGSIKTLNPKSSKVALSFLERFWDRVIKIFFIN